MARTKKSNATEEKQLMAFIKNVEMADTIRMKYPGNFVAICGQEVIDVDIECGSLMSKIPPEHLNEKELYIGYIPNDKEVLVV